MSNDGDGWKNDSRYHEETQCSSLEELIKAAMEKWC
jgi:hypothetical protein